MEKITILHLFTNDVRLQLYLLNEDTLYTLTLKLSETFVLQKFTHCLHFDHMKIVDL